MGGNSALHFLAELLAPDGFWEIKSHCLQFYAHWLSHQASVNSPSKTQSVTKQNTDMWIWESGFVGKGMIFQEIREIRGIIHTYEIVEE